MNCYDLVLSIEEASTGRLPNVPTIPCNWQEACDEAVVYFRAHGVTVTAEQVGDGLCRGELYLMLRLMRVTLSWQQRCRALTSSSSPTR